MTGGHTMEMMSMISGFGQTPLHPRTYVIAATDAISESKVVAFEQTLGSVQSKDYFIIRIPRSREVKQSWISTIWTTLLASVASLWVITKTLPDMIVCNGPGTCVPIAVLARVMRMVGLVDTQIVYVESFARVSSLSLSGRILYNIADLFVVQWPQLQAAYPRAIFCGRLV
eukprot:jgi/Hompol1/288/HPOL_005288-RA